MTVALLLLAAGSSSRMKGGDKLLEEVGHAPCLRVLAERGLDAGLPVFVTLRPQDDARRAALAGLDVTEVATADAHKGMSRSLRAGARAMPADISGMMVLPADMPAIEAGDMRLLAEAFESGPQDWPLRATTEDSLPGHPIVFPRAMLSAFDGLAGDLGAFALLRPIARHVRTLALPGQRARLDLDTPEEWAAWRADPA